MKCCECGFEDPVGGVNKYENCDICYQTKRDGWAGIDDHTIILVFQINQLRKDNEMLKKKLEILEHIQTYGPTWAT
jgi:hypothetical protein